MFSTFATGGLTPATATNLTFSGCLAKDVFQNWPASGTVDNGLCTGTGTTDAWYKFTATATTHYFILYTPFDAAIALYDAPAGTRLFCSNTVAAANTEFKSQSGLTIGVTYYVQILPMSGAGSGTGNVSMAVSDDAYCWTGWMGTGNVATAANYANNTAPSATSDVKISPSPVTAITLSSGSPAIFTVQQGATLAVTSDMSFAKITNNGVIQIQNVNTELTTADLYCASTASFTSTSGSSVYGIYVTDSLIVQTGGDLTFSPNGTNTEYLTVSKIYVQSGGALRYKDYTDFIASGNVVVDGSLRFDHLLVASNPQIGGNLTINGSLNHQGHRYISLTGSNKTISGTGNFYAGLSAPIDITNGASYTVGTLASNTMRLSHLRIETTGTLSIGANTVNTCFFIQTGVFNQNSGTLGIAGPSTYLMSAGVWSGTTWLNDGFAINPGITDANFNEGTGTTYFNSGDFTDANMFYVNDQTVPSVTYKNLKIRTNNTKTVTMGYTAGTSFNASGDLTIYNPGTAGGIATANAQITIGGDVYIGAVSGTNPSGNALTLNCAYRVFRSVGTGVITMGNNSAHNINISYLDAAANSDECFTGFGVPTFYGTVSYNGNGNQEIIPSTFYNITLAGTSGIKKALGNIFVTHDWTNNRATNGFDGSTYKVTFNGSVLQNITSTSATKYGTTFNKIEVNNSANVNISYKATVTSALGVDFTAGDFIANTSTEPLLFDVNATINTPASDNSHVNGYVAKNTNSVTKFTFPCGDGTMYRPCATTPNNTTSRTYTVKYFRAMPTNTALVSGGIDHISTVEYWDIAEPSTLGSIVELSWNSVSVVNNYTDLIIAHYKSSTPVWEPVTGAYSYTGNNTAGTLYSSSYWSSFSPFTLASRTALNVLPIELLKFEVTCDNENVNVFWETASETNNDYFVIQRSEDAIAWNDLAIIDGSDSKSVNKYLFTDSQPLGRLSYYRLKQVDLNGEFEVFNAVSSDCDVSTKQTISIYPNPSQTVINVKMLGVADNALVSLKIFDTTGKLISIRTVNLEAQEFTLNIEDLAKGLYMLVVDGGNFSFKEKVIKE